MGREAFKLFPRGLRILSSSLLEWGLDRGLTIRSTASTTTVLMGLEMFGGLPVENKQIIAVRVGRRWQLDYW